MSTPFMDKIRAILPNLPIPALRQMIPWFEAASSALDGGGALVAGAVIDGGANVQRSFGLRTVTPVTHSSAGNFVLHLATLYDVNTLYVSANIYSPTTPPAGAINIYPTFSDGETLALALWQIAATTAVRSQVDEQFIALVYSQPFNV